MKDMELRYDCPICKGAAVLNVRNNKNGVPVNVSCWKCNGKGYLISNSGK
jgi:DnaJ-class molecular chaperone